MIVRSRPKREVPYERLVWTAHLLSAGVFVVLDVFDMGPVWNYVQAHHDRAWLTPHISPLSVALLVLTLYASFAQLHRAGKPKLAFQTALLTLALARIQAYSYVQHWFNMTGP